MAWLLKIVDGHPVRERELKPAAANAAVHGSGLRQLSDGRVKDCLSGVVDYPGLGDYNDPEPDWMLHPSRGNW